MNLHADAKLSLKGRLLLIDRVENAGWSLKPRMPRVGAAAGA